MNIAQAWEGGSGTATTNFHGMGIIVKFVDDDHVDIRFGTKETGYKHIPKSPVWAFKGWMRDLGIDPREGWMPGKDHDEISAQLDTAKTSVSARHQSGNHKRRAQRRK